jgi:hypothetical protein
MPTMMNMQDIPDGNKKIKKYTYELTACPFTFVKILKYELVG